MGGYMARLASIALSVALVLGAGSPQPAEAKKKGGKNGRPCTEFVAPEVAADAEVVKVTHRATNEDPIEVTVPTSAGVGMGRDPGGTGATVSHAYVPVQVDSLTPTADLYVVIFFNKAWSYELYLDDPDGTMQASSGAGYASGVAFLDTNVRDCSGFVVDIVGGLTPGEDVTLTLNLAPPRS